MGGQKIENGGCDLAYIKRHGANQKGQFSFG